MKSLSIQGIIFDRDGTLTYDFTHSEQEGDPLPGIVELLQQLRAKDIPLAIATNQAGPLYEALQERILVYNPQRRRVAYPTVEKVVEDIARSLRLLGVEDIPLCVSTYDPRIESLLIHHETGLPPGREPDVLFPPASYPRNEGMDMARTIMIRMQESFLRMGFTAGVGCDPSWRKPAPGMLQMIASYWGIAKEEYSQVIYCGDMHTNKNGTIGSDQEAAEAAGMTFVKAEDIHSLLSMV